LTRSGDVVQWLAPDIWHEAALGANFRDVVQVSPALARTQIDDDNPVAALAARVGDVRYALAGCGDRRSQVEAHVVEVGVAECNGGGEYDCFDHAVGGDVYADELGAAV